MRDATIILIATFGWLAFGALAGIVWGKIASAAEREVIEARRRAQGQ